MAKATLLVGLECRAVPQLADAHCYKTSRTPISNRAIRSPFMSSVFRTNCTSYTNSFSSRHTSWPRDRPQPHESIRHSREFGCRSVHNSSLSFVTYAGWRNLECFLLFHLRHYIDSLMLLITTIYPPSLSSYNLHPQYAPLMYINMEQPIVHDW